MRSAIVAVFLLTVVAVAIAGREKRKSFGGEKVKHGDHQHPHKRFRKQDLGDHKPVVSFHV